MNFDFSEEQKLLQQTARDYLAEHAPLTTCREVVENGDQNFSKGLWKGAAELGWLGTAIPEEHGGAGFGHLELAVVAEEIGRALAPIPFTSSTAVFTEAVMLAGNDAQKQKWLPKLASGEAVGTFALAESAGQSDVGAVSTSFDGNVLSGTKLPVAAGDIADVALVSAKQGDDLVLAIAELGGNGVQREAVESIDPSRTLARVAFDGAAAEVLASGADARKALDKLLDRSATLVAFEQLGGATRAFEITREFTLGRYAFGRSIASFQAIKHRLADLWCEIELARSNCYYAAWALEGNEPELSLAAATAHISASNAYHLATVEMLQMHGGVGFTWEYDCHLFYRRAKWLQLALGGTTAWSNKLVDRLASEAA